MNLDSKFQLKQRYQTWIEEYLKDSRHCTEERKYLCKNQAILWTLWWNWHDITILRSWSYPKIYVFTLYRSFMINLSLSAHGASLTWLQGVTDCFISSQLSFTSLINFFYTFIFFINFFYTFIINLSLSAHGVSRAWLQAVTDCFISSQLGGKPRYGLLGKANSFQQWFTFFNSIHLSIHF